MQKYLFALMILSLAGSGCAAQDTSSNLQPQGISTKVLSWCDDTSHSSEVWIASEYFNGMNHAPTVRHLCRENRELFFLHMDWDDTVSIHTGTLTSKKSNKTFSITSTHRDPEFALLNGQSKDKNHIWFTMDGEVFMYNETTDEFIKNGYE